MFLGTIKTDQSLKVMSENWGPLLWLGNAGSHEGTELSNNDVLDAYEIMEHLLAEIYNNKGARLAALAKKVNRNKGPK